MAQLLGESPVVDRQPERPGDIRHSAADISAAQEALGYEPLTSLEEGLEQTIAAARTMSLASVA